MPKRASSFFVFFTRGVDFYLKKLYNGVDRHFHTEETEMKRLFLCILAFSFVLATASCKKANDEQPTNDNVNQNQNQQTQNTPPHECTYDATSQTIPATCEEGGYTVYTCICGKVREDNYTEALGHSYGKWFVYEEPTLSSGGELRRNCCNADHYETADLPILNAVDYTVTLIESDDRYGVSCITPLPAEYKYTTELYDEEDEEKLTFGFTADYLANHTYINDYVYSFDAHYPCCRQCGNVDETAEHPHSFKDNKCTVCGFTDRLMIYSDESYGFAVTYTANEQNAVIPDFYLESYVTSDASAIKGIESFKNNDKLRSLTIPSTIEYISDYAFEGCTSLETIYYNGTWDQWCSIDFGASANPMNYAENFYILNGSIYNSVNDIVLSDTLHVISGSALQGFKNITSITIPKSITAVGSKLDSVFSEGTKIGTVYYGGDYTDWLSVSINNKNSNPMQFTNNFYMTDSSGKHYTPSNITIPDSVTKIGNYQFFGYSALNSLTVTSSLESIGDYAFSECISLATVNISENCETIGYYAFLNCTELSEVHLPAGLKVVENFAFKECTRIKKIFYGSDIGGWCAIKFGGPSANPMHVNEERSIDDSVDFYLYSKEEDKYYSTESETITIPDNVNVIGDYQFYGFAKIAQIIISDGTTTIGDSAFACCSNLSALKIPKSITSIGKNALRNSNIFVEIYYDANQSNWDKIAIESPNTELNNAERYYCAEINDMTVFS